MAQHDSQNEQLEEEFVEEGPGGFAQLLLNTPSWLVSTIVHVVFLLILALMTVSGAQKTQIVEIISEPPVEELIDEEEPEEIDIEMIDPEAEVTDEVVEVTEFAEVTAVEADEPAPAMVEVDPNAIGTLTPSNVGKSISNYSGSGLGLRAKAKQTAKMRGANSASELAVARGLRWIANHQYPTGGWSFDHTKAPKCQGKCKNPGSNHTDVNAATSMGILPFLGCGITHKEGKQYKNNVRAGLYFLVKRMKLEQGKGGSFHERTGTMYSHGLAAICLTEAYGMTKDKALQMPAQQAINFIQYAQDPAGGGWRYQPRQQGDTSVVGWQLMALKSGYMAYLNVQPQVPQKAMQFLDSVQSNSGSNYGYNAPGAGSACTAIGLLCRMYYGWKKENPALERGVEWLSNRGPSKGDMYYNYYATQVLHHFDGEPWHKWNNTMRDQLVNTQCAADKKSCDFGSWYTKGGDHGDEKGGRLYKTALSVMTLEVYYRHSPIYRKQSMEGGLPLE
ncbi:MAG: terpene cyclase/mutase family protein [Planctomycetia bacterium]|nr:terpene cyclase/mutase family protein [Planctomycetia bacterium]